MTAHSRIFTWKISWTEAPGRLQSTGSQRVRHKSVAKQQREFSKLAGRKITTENSAAFPYNNNERAEGETQEMIPFTSQQIEENVLGINLLEEAEVLYSENYKMLRKEIKAHAQMERMTCSSM